MKPADDPREAPGKPVVLPVARPTASWRRWLGVWLLRLGFHAAGLVLIAACLCLWVAMLAPYRFSPEARRAFEQADARWPSDHGWVWINTSSGIYHRPGTRWYGNTGSGKYLPEWAAWLEGYRVAANGQ